MLFRLLVALLLISALPARAAELDERDRADIARVEQYLSGIGTMVSRFEQVDQSYGTSKGTIYLQRPGKLRFEYDPPVPYLIVANGSWLLHYDKELKAATYVGQDQTPAWFLLTPKVSLTGDVTVTRIERGEGVLRLDVVKTASPRDGTVTIELSTTPLQIRGWTIVDAQGAVTKVTLHDPKFGESIPPDTFAFDDPSMKMERANP